MKKLYSLLKLISEVKLDFQDGCEKIVFDSI